jgi:hypothetical protein
MKPTDKKFQIPKNKFQIIHKHKYSMTETAGFEFGNVGI